MSFNQTFVLFALVVLAFAGQSEGFSLLKNIAASISLKKDSFGTVKHLIDAVHHGTKDYADVVHDSAKQSVNNVHDSVSKNLDLHHETNKKVIDISAQTHENVIDAFTTHSSGVAKNVSYTNTGAQDDNVKLVKSVIVDFTKKPAPRHDSNLNANDDSDYQGNAQTIDFRKKFTLEKANYARKEIYESNDVTKQTITTDVHTSQNVPIAPNDSPSEVVQHQQKSKDNSIKKDEENEGKEVVVSAAVKIDENAVNEIDNIKKAVVDEVVKAKENLVDSVVEAKVNLLDTAKNIVSILGHSKEDKAHHTA